MKTVEPLPLFQLSSFRSVLPRHTSDEAFAKLRTVAAAYWFTAEEHDDGTVTLRGPSYSGINCKFVEDLNKRLPREVAKVRLLSEVCCAIAHSTGIFTRLDNALDMPFVIENSKIHDTATRWRALHSDVYRKLGEAQVKQYAPAAQQ